MAFTRWPRLACFAPASGTDSDSEDSNLTPQQSLKAAAGLTGSTLAASTQPYGVRSACGLPQSSVNVHNPASRCGLNSYFGSQSTLSEDGSYYVRCGTNAALTRENTNVSDVMDSDPFLAHVAPVAAPLPKMHGSSTDLEGLECPGAPRRATPPPPSRQPFTLLDLGDHDDPSDLLGIHPDFYNFVPLFTGLARQETSLSEDPRDAAVYELLEPDMCVTLEHHSWGSTLSR